MSETGDDKGRKDETRAEYLARINGPASPKPKFSEEDAERDRASGEIVGGLFVAAIVAVSAYVFLYLPEKEANQVRDDLQEEIDRNLTDLDSSIAEMNDAIDEYRRDAEAAEGMRKLCADHPEFPICE